MNSVPVSFGGGYEVFITNLAKRLRSQGHEAILLEPQRVLALAYSTPLGVRLHERLDVKELVDLQLLHTRNLRDAVRLMRASHVVYAKNEPHELLFSVFASGRSPLVVGFHSAMTGRPGVSGRVREYAYRSSFYKKLLQRTTRCHALQDSQRRFLVAHHAVREEIVAVIPNGVDLGDFYPVQEPAHGDKFRMLFVGRLALQKGIDTLLESLSVFEPSSSWSITIAGTGVLEADVRALSKTLPAIDFIGYSKSTAALYRRHDVVIAPSRWEVQSLVPAEALASGLPIILTNIDSNSAYLPCEAAIAVPVSNSGELGKAMTNVNRVWSRDQPSFLQLQREARQFALAHLDQGDHLAHVVDLLREAATSRVDEVAGNPALPDERS